MPIKKKLLEIENNSVVKEVDIGVQYPEKIEIDGKETIPIVFCASNYYVPVMSVCIESIIQHKKEQYFYDIFVFYRSISDENAKILRTLGDDKNVSVRLVNVNACINNIKIKDSFNAMEIYFKLFIPYVLKNYDGKAIYLDSDIVCNHDVAELYCEDLGRNPIGGVKHLYLSTMYQLDGGARLSYCYKNLGMKDALNYINTGMLLFDLSLFRKYLGWNALIDICNYNNWHSHEQDVINVIFESHMKYLPAKYNFTVESEKRKLLTLIKYFDYEKYEEFLSAKDDPCIIHYASGTRPWDSMRVDFAEEWWKYAEKSPFYPALKRDYISKQES